MKYTFSVQFSSLMRNQFKECLTPILNEWCQSRYLVPHPYQEVGRQWEPGTGTPQNVLWEMQTDCKCTLYFNCSATQRNWARRELQSFRFPRISLSFNIKVHNNHHILNGTIEINVWKTSPRIKKKRGEWGSTVISIVKSQSLNEEYREGLSKTTVPTIITNQGELFGGKSVSLWKVCIDDY